MKGKLTRQERSWILYDVGNSAFTLLISTIMPIYFNALAEGRGCPRWITWPTGAMPPPLPPCWWR